MFLWRIDENYPSFIIKYPPLSNEYPQHKLSSNTPLICFTAYKLFQLLSSFVIWAGAWQNQQNVCPEKTQLNLGMCLVWSVYAVHFMDSEGPKASSCSGWSSLCLAHRCFLKDSNLNWRHYEDLWTVKIWAGSPGPGLRAVNKPS